jgi:hypothetical protein
LRYEQSLHVRDHSLIDAGLSHRPISSETRGDGMAARDAFSQAPIPFCPNTRSPRTCRTERRRSPCGAWVVSVNPKRGGKRPSVPNYGGPATCMGSLTH